MRSSVSVHIARSKYAEDTLKVLRLSRESLEPYQGIGGIQKSLGVSTLKGMAIILTKVVCTLGIEKTAQ